MRYRSLDEMSNFIDSVRIDARMLNSTVSIADIAFFAPELKGIQQIATLTGTASGTISNFVVNGLELKTGRSRLAGTYSMNGLVDV
jgi:hypothetical protein